MALRDYCLTEDLLPGGKGDGADPSEFDRAEVAAGVHHEMEHTDDPRKALEIALDHLTENPTYYSDLGAGFAAIGKED